MSEIIIYYTIGGKSKKYSEKRADEEVAEVIEVKEKKNRGKLGAIIPGIFQAKGQKETKILPLGKSLEDFDTITLVTPIWAGCHAPAMNSVAKLIPSGKNVRIVAVSGKGKGYGEALATKVKDAGGDVIEIINIESATIN